MSHLTCTRIAGSQLIRRSSWRSSLALFLLLVCGAFATDAAAQENDGVAQSGSGSDYVTNTVGSAAFSVYSSSLFDMLMFGADQSNVPAEIRVPEGQKLVLRTVGAGVQIYNCVQDAWMFREPSAILYRKGAPVAIHYAGPTWQSIQDSSKVTGAVRARVDAPNPADDIPWLLLQATTNTGVGKFGEVTYIQRLNTRGGVAPTGTCDATQKPSVAVPYMAIYNFWALKR